jgi:hypothetical protein
MAAAVIGWGSFQALELLDVAVKVKQFREESNPSVEKLKNHHLTSVMFESHMRFRIFD